MGELDVLKQLLKQNLLVDISDKGGIRSVTLRERDSQAKLKTVCVGGLPEGTVVLATDNCRPGSSLFRSSLGECRRCDYVILAQTKRKGGVAVLIELKSWPGSGESKTPQAAESTEAECAKKCGEKFKATECILDYCDAALDRFHNQTALLKHYHKHYFVVFYKAPHLEKKPTRLERPPNDKPDCFLKYPVVGTGGPFLEELVV